MDIVLCIRELGTVEKTPGTDMSACCGREDKLSSVSIEIEDHVMACFLLASLVADPNYATYLRTTRIDKDLNARVVKSDLLLEERRIDAAAESSERDSAMATRRQGKPKQQYKDGARPKIRDVHDQRCYKCGKMGHISYQCLDEKGDKEERNQSEKKRQEDNKTEEGSEDKPRSKGFDISTLALSSISHMGRGRISYLDSGASNHITPDRHRFGNFTPTTGQIMIGNDHLEVKGKGTIVVKMAESCGGWTLSLSNALWVPELDVNLISIRQLAKKGVTTVSTRDKAVGTHDDGDVVFNSKVGDVVFNSKVGDDVYYLETVPVEEYTASLSVENDQEEPAQDDGDVEVIEARAYKGITSWQEKLGHLHGNAMRKIPIRSAKEESKKQNELCGVCVKGKMTKVPFPKTAHHMCQRLLEIVHSDVSDRAQCMSLDGGNYFVTFIDDFSRFMYVRIISRKSEVFR